MTKLVLLSLGLSMIAVPVWAASQRNAVRGIKLALFAVAAYSIVFMLLVRFFVTRYILQ